MIPCGARALACTQPPAPSATPARMRAAPGLQATERPKARNQQLKTALALVLITQLAITIIALSEKQKLGLAAMVKRVIGQSSKGCRKACTRQSAG